MSSPAPIRSLTWILGCLLPEREYEPVLGDLVEEYELRSRSRTIPSVSRWYCSQVLRSIVPLVCASIRRSGWLVTVCAAFGAYLVANVVETATELLLFRFVASGSQAYFVLVLVIGLASMMLGGYIAAWLRPPAATILAAMVIVVVGALMIAVPESAPLWYQLGFLLLGPLASFAGGALAIGEHRART